MKHALLVFALAACSGGKKTVIVTDTETRGGSGEQPGGGGAPGDPAPRGMLEEGELQAVGAIDKSVVRKVVREHFEALRYCYEATLLANPNIAGTVIAKFTIEIDGTVHDVKASGVHPDVESCVTTKVRGFRFPRPDGSKVEVAYPFTFKPS